MRRRRWVAVVAVLIIVVLSGSFLTLKVGSRHPAVKRAVLGRILPEVGGRLSVGELEFGLASIGLRDVDVEMGPRGSIHLPAATVSLSYSKLIMNGLEPRRALSTVIVSGPVVHLRYGFPEDERPTTPGLLELGPYLPDYLGVSEAVVVLEDARTGRSVGLSSLDLLIERGEGGRADGRATASALGGDANLFVEFSWDTLDEILTANAGISGARLSPNIPFPDGFTVTPVEGSVDATSTAVLSSGPEARWNVEFVVSDAELGLPSGMGVAHGVSAEGGFDAGNFSATVSSAEWKGASTSGSVDVDLAGRSFRTIELTTRGLAASTLADLGGGLPASVEGTLSLDATAAGPWDDLSADLAVRSPSVALGGTRFSDVVADVSYTAGRYDVTDLSFGVFGGGAGLTGSVGPEEDGERTFEVRGGAADLDAGAVAGAFGRPGWSGSVSISGLELSSRGDVLDVESLLSWRGIAMGPVAVGSGAGGFILRDDVLSGTLAAANGSAALSGEVLSLSMDPSVEAELVLTEVLLDSLTASGGSPLPGMAFTGTLAAAGPLEGFSVDGSLRALCDYCDASVSLDGIVGLGKSGGSASLELRSHDAVVRDVETPFAASLHADGTSVRLAPLEVEGIGELTLEIDTDGARGIRGSAVVSEADLSEVVRILSGTRLPPSMNGLLFASVSVGGTLDSPSASGQIQVGNGEAAGVADLGAVLSATLDDGIVDIREMNLSESGRLFVDVRGTAELGGELALAITGEGVPGPLLAGDGETLFDVGFGVGGTWSGPALDGTIEGRDGSFLGVSFDELLARVTGAAGIVSVDPLLSGETRKLSGEGQRHHTTRGAVR